MANYSPCTSLKIRRSRVVCIEMAEPPAKLPRADRGHLNRMRKLAKKYGGWVLWQPPGTGRGRRIELWAFESHTALGMFERESQAALDGKPLKQAKDTRAKRRVAKS